MNLIDVDFSALEQRVMILATDMERMFMGRRELPIALAHCMVKGKPGSPRMELLNRIFNSMNLVDCIQCRAELARCRRAISDPQPAEIK